MTRRRLAAVIGSADSRRSYQPPIVDADGACLAAQQLGAALAKAGWSLIVYSDHGEYIERDVVHGFASSCAEDKERIHVWQPRERSASEDRFPELSSRRGLFAPRPAISGAVWQASVFKSMDHADGLILIGGGDFALATTLAAIRDGIPIVALPCFGGAASTVWDELKSWPIGSKTVPTLLATEDEINAMSRDWSADQADRLVTILNNQRKRRRPKRHRTANEATGRVAGVMACLLVLAVLLVSILVSNDWPPHPLSALLVVAPLVAGGTTGLWAGRSREFSGIESFVAGALAGFGAGVVFLVGQLLTSPNLMGEMEEAGSGAVGARNVAILATLVGFVAGLSSNSVLANLSRLNAVTPAPLDSLPVVDRQGSPVVRHESHVDD